MKNHSLVALAAMLAVSLVAGPADAADASVAKQPMQGEKIDSGLGQLPHYRYWADKTGKTPVQHSVAGEKIDSGLGDIKPGSLSRTSVDVAKRQ